MGCGVADDYGYRLFHDVVPGVAIALSFLPGA
jgi:hypothetical protein